MDFQSSNKKDLERFADKYGLKLGSVSNNPNYGLEAEFEGSTEDLKKFMTSDDYGLDPKDFDQYAKEYGDELDVDPKIDKQMATLALENLKNFSVSILFLFYDFSFSLMLGHN